jgi:hypothetical protein
MDMPVKNTFTKPKMADGTADWEAIFENSQSGLIPLVSKAKSVDGLRACATLVINQLFTRKNDEKERARLNAMLADLFTHADAGDDVDAARQGAIRILRGIKQERLLKAAAYVADKNSKHSKPTAQGGGAERRTNDVFRLFGSGQPLLIAIAVLSLLAVSAIGVAVMIDFDSRSKLKPQSVEEVDKVVESPKVSPPVLTKPEPVTKPPQLKQPDYPKTIYFKPMYWVTKTTRMQRSYTYYQASVLVPDKAGYSAVCRRRPTINDALNIAISGVHPDIGKAGGDVLRRAAERAYRQINKKLGAGTISRVDIFMDGDSAFRANAASCR